MGLLDWIYRQFKRISSSNTDPDEGLDSSGLPPLSEDGLDLHASPPIPLPPPLLPSSSPPAPPQKAKKVKKAKAKAKVNPPTSPRQSRPEASAAPDPTSPLPDRPRKKKRKQPKGDPRFRKATPPPPAPSAPQPPLPPLVTRAAPTLPPPPVPEPAPIAAVPEPVVVVAAATPEPAVVVAEVEVAEIRGRERGVAVVEREEETLAWVVLPKAEALLAEVDGVLAEATAEREGLRRARRQLEGEWRRLLPLPLAHAERLEGAYAERHAALSARLSAIPSPQEEEETRSLAVREALLAEAEALVAAPDLRAALDRARELQQKWKDAGRVPRASLDEVHGRWKAGMDALYARRDAERTERLQKLGGLASQAELLAKSRDADRAADAMKGLQQRWKDVGGVRGEEADALWTRFRAAADQIFERRRVAHAERQLRNQQAREALIAHAQELAAAGGVADPEEVVRHLQERWRRIGPVPREQAEGLWERFRAACDALHRPPAPDPELLQGGEEPLRFSPFAALGGGAEE